MANILLVDDEPLVIEALSNAITSKGHTVVTASNGVQAMEKFNAEKFDLVITDIIMPSYGFRKLTKASNVSLT